MVDISSYCHFQATRQSFEDAFYLVVLVLALRFNV